MARVLFVCRQNAGRSQEHKLSAQAALDQAQRQATDLLARHR
jgi:protein-tyrosine-phosphatase